MKITAFFTALSLLIISSTAVASAASKDEVAAFFQQYTQLGETFDATVADLYSEKASILMSRVTPDGSTRSMQLDGAKWKPLVRMSMPLGKARGDISKFSIVGITLDGAKAKIEAKRYSVLKCYTDADYFMVIEKDEMGNYLIIEESFLTQSQSNCAQPSSQTP